MDQQDLQLIQLRVHEPRATYSDLADALDLSVQAVHRRIQLLQGSKIILGTTVTLSTQYLEAVPVTIYGRSTGGTKAEITRGFESNDRISGVLFGSGGVLTINVLLRRISELNEVLNDVMETARMPYPWAGIEIIRENVIDPATMATEPLSSLDRRIIFSLARDGRKPSTEVAKELNVTAATVKRRLRRMTDIGALEFTTMLHPGFSGDVISIFQVELEEGTERSATISRLRRRLGPIAEYYRTFSNAPERITFVTWNSTLRDLELLIEQVQSEPGIKRAMPDIMYTGWYHPTWRDKMVLSKL